MNKSMIFKAAELRPETFKHRDAHVRDLKVIMIGFLHKECNHPIEDIAEIFGLERTTIYNSLERYNQTIAIPYIAEWHKHLKQRYIEILATASKFNMENRSVNHPFNRKNKTIRRRGSNEL